MFLLEKIKKKLRNNEYNLKSINKIFKNNFLKILLIKYFKIYIFYLFF